MSLTITRKVSVTGGTVLRASNNLGDVGSVPTAQANLGLPALRNALAPGQSLSFNGTAQSTFANVTAIGSGGYVTAALSLDVPATNPAIISTLFNLCGFGQGLGDPRQFNAYIQTNGTLVFRQNGATTSDWRIATVTTNIVSAYAGTRVNLCLVISPANAVCYINGQSAAFTETTGGTPPAWGESMTGTYLYLGSSGSDCYFTDTLRLLGVWNYAFSQAQVTQLNQQNAVNSADINSASNTSLPTGTNSDFSGATTTWTLGTATVSAGKLNLIASSNPFTSSCSLVQGKRYRFNAIVSACAGNLQYWNGAAYVTFASAPGTYDVEFTALATYGFLTLWSTSTSAVDTITFYNLGLLVAPDWAGYTGGPQVIDVSGNGADTNLPGDGVTGGVVPTLRGATPSPFRATRTSSGYLIADQVVIPPGCSVEIWAKGNGTFSLGDSSGTPASIVNAQTAPTNLSPIAQAGYVTATRKLYLTLGSATSVTVRVTFKSV